MPSKIYVVIKGKGSVPNIFSNWNECKSVVTGIPNAVYKSFTNVIDALQYLLSNSNISSEQAILLFKNLGLDVSNLLNNQSENKPALANYDLIAFVDGSFSEKMNKYSYGVVLLKENEVIKHLIGSGSGKEAEMRQIYGEILGAMKAVEFAAEHKFNSILICYDYAGIELWAKGSWSRKNEFTEKYHQFMQKSMKKLNIGFEKITAHSGNVFNELADSLAKSALK